MYVGQSAIPQTRFHPVLLANGIDFASRSDYRLTVLRQVSQAEAMESEADTIAEYWDKGECEWNRRATAGSRRGFPYRHPKPEGHWVNVPKQRKPPKHPKSPELTTRA
jgi:hypothetical protein